MLLYRCCVVVALSLENNFYFVHARLLKNGVHHKKLMALTDERESSITDLIKFLLQNSELIQEAASLKMELDRYKQQERRNQEKSHWRPGWFIFECMLD